MFFFISTSICKTKIFLCLTHTLEYNLHDISSVRSGFVRLLRRQKKRTCHPRLPATAFLQQNASLHGTSHTKKLPVIQVTNHTKHTVKAISDASTHQAYLESSSSIPYDTVRCEESSWRDRAAHKSSHAQAHAETSLAKKKAMYSPADADIHGVHRHRQSQRQNPVNGQ